MKRILAVLTALILAAVVAAPAEASGPPTPAEAGYVACNWGQTIWPSWVSTHPPDSASTGHTCVTRNYYALPGTNLADIDYQVSGWCWSYDERVRIAKANDGTLGITSHLAYWEGEGPAYASNGAWCRANGGPA